MVIGDGDDVGDVVDVSFNGDVVDFVNFNVVGQNGDVGDVRDVLVK